MIMQEKGQAILASGQGSASIFIQREYARRTQGQRRADANHFHHTLQVSPILGSGYTNYCIQHSLRRPLSLAPSSYR